jgi:hypothetical protein
MSSFPARQISMLCILAFSETSILAWGAESDVEGFVGVGKADPGVGVGKADQGVGVGKAFSGVGVSVERPDIVMEEDARPVGGCIGEPELTD